MMPKRETAQASEERGTVKAKYAGFLWLVLFGIIMIVVLCAFVSVVGGLVGLLHGGIWDLAMGVFVLASFMLGAMITTLPASEGEGMARHFGLGEWTLASYFFMMSLGFNWACAFLWFSRRYAFFSTPVIGATGLIMALYGVVALLVARLTGRNWRTALLVFVFVPDFVACIVLWSRLLR